jgi:hypothetical protein
VLPEVGGGLCRIPFDDHAPSIAEVAFRLLVCPTLRITCEAVPPSIPPAGAQGGTSACSTGAALSFVSFIDEMDSSNDSVGIDVPESLLCRQGGAHPCRTIRALR